MYWEKKTYSEIKSIVFNAINNNMNFRDKPILGIPGTYLDADVFYHDAPFLKDAPFIEALVENPNHIGCHTIAQSERIFKGTQQLEIDLIRLCAEEIFSGEPNMQDGYVASGGTEANIYAMWLYREYFIREYNAKQEEIGVIYSEDTHYSIPKGLHLLKITSLKLKVEEDNRQIIREELESTVKAAMEKGVKYFIVVMNLGTTMFGSVDDIDGVTDFLEQNGIPYKLHVDAAFGGFMYPFTNANSNFNFKNPRINSFTLDAHKLLQAPFGTGIFLTRKGYVQYACTEEAQYVQGGDYTLCGSRSGANVVAVWMILHTHGSEGWRYKMQKLIDRALRLCCQLDEIGVKYYRDPFMNIITIDANYISNTLAEKYYLVPDTHDGHPKHWKIVVMPHVKQGTIDQFFSELRAQRS